MIYLDSLRATREMDLAVVLPGPRRRRSTTTRALIDERFRLHERRAAKLAGLIAERPRTAYELAQAMWGNVAVTQAYLTLSRGARPRRPARSTAARSSRTCRTAS